VFDRAARAKLNRIVNAMTADSRKAWDLHPDGSYVQRTPPLDADPESPAVLGTFGVLMRDTLG
jgi:hypothetical protein